jgi:hypothetical protein
MALPCSAKASPGAPWLPEKYYQQARDEEVIKPLLTRQQSLQTPVIKLAPLEAVFAALKAVRREGKGVFYGGVCMYVYRAEVTLYTNQP